MSDDSGCSGSPEDSVDCGDRVDPGAEDRVVRHARELRSVTLAMMPEPVLPERGHPRGNAR